MNHERRELLRQLQAVEHLLQNARPRRSVQWAALFNLMVVSCEDDSSPASNVALVQLMRAWMQDCRPELPEAELHRRVEKVARALVALNDAPPPIPQTPRAASSPIGPDTLQLVARLRQELGLSLLYIHRHLSEHLQRPISYEDLLLAVHGAVTAPHLDIATA